MSFKEYLKRKFYICQFATKLWFLSGEELEIEAEISKLVPMLEETRAAIHSDPEESKGIVDFMKVCFLREVWVTEIGTSLSHGETEEVIMKIMEGADSEISTGDINDRTLTKVSNLKKVLDAYPDFCMPEGGLTVATICDLHKVIGNGLIPSAGQFRTTYAGAARTSVVYADPCRISSHLETLVKFTNEILHSNFETQGIRLKTMIRLAALLFSEFLKIHPFSNGNGRVARMLVNFILSADFIVPISIFLSLTREDYLKLLYEAQWNANPNGLVTAFFLSAKFTVQKAEYLLLE
jgi:fido (protein-threonine AMPylation protein)